MAMDTTFPRFPDGDVKIRLSKADSDVFKVHSFVLALHSSFFKASLSNRWNEPSACSSKPSWEYELRLDKDLVYGAILTRVNENGVSSDKLYDESAPNTDEAERGRSIVSAHRELLGLFYHIPLKWDLCHFCPNTRVKIMELVDIADMYDCETLATQAIDRELLYAQDSVVDECAREPGDMIGLALALQCEWLYREAATHLLGRSRVAYFEQLGEFFDDHARCLLRRRRNIFVKSLQNAERSLWTIQPKPKDHWSYIAVSFFRQWLSDRIETGEGSRLAPGYARLYHDLAKANCSIKTGISAHLELIGMKSNESNIQTLESNLSTVLKAAAKTIKNDLLPNQARQPTDAKDGYRALTFCSPGHSELPWTVKGEDLCVLAEEYDSMEEISDDDI